MAISDARKHCAGGLEPTTGNLMKTGVSRPAKLPLFRQRAISNSKMRFLFQQNLSLVNKFNIKSSTIKHSKIIQY